MSGCGEDQLVQLGLLPATVVLTCRTSEGRATRHPVTIGTDWTVDTGHDIESERLAAALGGRLSCLDLIDNVDYTLPAARQWLLANLRIGHPGITSGDGRRWRPVRAARCCPRSGFADPAKASEHVRSQRHIGTQLGAPPRHLAAVIRHWSPLLAQNAPPPTDHRYCYLWECGLTPDHIHNVERELQADEPLPLELHLALMAAQPDLTWFSEAIAAHREAPSAAVWIAWESARWEQIALPERLEWLSQPIPPRLALVLGAAGMRAQDVHRLAEAQACTLTRAANQLVSWVETGLQPSIDDLIALDHDRGLLPAPSRAAVTRARAGFPSLRRHSDLTIALALARHGYAKAAAAALEQPPRLANYLTD